MEKALSKIKTNLKLLKDHFEKLDGVATLNRPESVEGESFTYCEECINSCKRFYKRKKDRASWLLGTQIILSKTLMFIVEYMRQKVLARQKDKQDELEEMLETNETEKLTKSEELIQQTR